MGEETQYTDEDLLNATQVAYLNFSEEKVNELIDNGIEPTLANLLAADPQNMEFAQEHLE